MNPVNWFEIPVKDIERAKTFYEKVFGFTLERHDFNTMKMAWFPMTNEAPGATGSLVEEDSYAPSGTGTGVVLYFSVDDIKATLAKADSNGGEILQPKIAIGEYGFIGHFIDSEGNRVGLHSMK
jgi:uncharacterized protein